MSTASSSNEIEPGDIVQLKSGGPLMTVRQVVRESAYCLYFDNNGIIQEARDIAVISLKKVAPPRTREDMIADSI